MLYSEKQLDDGTDDLHIEQVSELGRL